MEVVLLALAAVVACVVHAALGFGSGPLLVPALLLAVEPSAAVVAAIVVGVTVNVLQLAAERRRPRPPRRVVGPLALAALPGVAAGAAVSTRLPGGVVSLVLAVVLLVCAAALLAAPARDLRMGPAALRLAGAGVGASAALTGVFGPLLGTLLTARGCRGDALRDGIGASFVLVGTAALAARLLADPSGADGLPLALALLVPAAAGHALGRRAFAAVTPEGHRRGVLLAVLAGGALTVAGALA